jgi:hypothetical protein
LFRNVFEHLLSNFNLYSPEIERWPYYDLMWRYRCRKTTKYRILISEKNVTSWKFLTPGVGCCQMATCISLIIRNYLIIPLNGTIHSSSMGENLLLILSNIKSSVVEKKRFYNVDAVLVPRVKSQPVSLWMFFSSLNAWICVKMCDHNYRIV